MSTTRTVRAIAACGLLYPIMTVIGFAAFPKPPGGDVSAVHDPQWLASHTGAVIAQSFVRAIAAVGFIVLAVAVARVAERGTMRSRSMAGLIIAGGATCGALLLAAQTTTLAAALAVRDHLSPASIRPLDELNAALLDMSSLPAVALFAAAGAVLLRHDTAPRWLAVLTLIGAPLALLDALSYDGGPFAAVGIIGLAYFLIWTLIIATYLARDSIFEVTTAVPLAA